MALHPSAAESALPPAVAGPAFLRDGTEVWVRRLAPEDRPLIAEFLGRSSEESLAARYFMSLRPAVAEAEIVAPSEPELRLCLLVLGERSDRIAVLGIGEYVRLMPDGPAAEVAFLVDELYRGRGIATLLLARLARAARGFGMRRFEARVRSENPEMLEVFRGRGLGSTEDVGDGELEVRIPLGPEADGGPIPEAAPFASTGLGRRA